MKEIKLGVKGAVFLVFLWLISQGVFGLIIGSIGDLVEIDNMASTRILILDLGIFLSAKQWKANYNNEENEISLH